MTKMKRYTDYKVNWLLIEQAVNTDLSISNQDTNEIVRAGEQEYASLLSFVLIESLMSKGLTPDMFNIGAVKYPVFESSEGEAAYIQSRMSSIKYVMTDYRPHIIPREVILESARTIAEELVQAIYGNDLTHRQAPIEMYIYKVVTMPIQYYTDVEAGVEHEYKRVMIRMWSNE